MMKQISSLFVVFLFDVAFAQKYIITRQVKNSRNEIQPDLVQIPSSLCHNNGTTECPLMDGERHSVCQCACNEQQSFRLYKSTFGFYNGTWKCAKNSVVRQHSGCLLALDGAREIDSVTLSLNDTVRHTLSDLTTGLYIQLPVGTTCTVRAQNFAYLNCTGEWEQLDSTLVAKRFQISYGTPSEGKYFVRVWVNATGRLSYPLPSGRIIRLAVNCSDRPWESSQCIVAKIQGQLECPVPSFPASSTTTPRPSTTASTVFTSATPSLSTAQPPTVSSSIPPVPPRIPSSISQTPSLSTTQPPTVSSSIPPVPPRIPSSINQTSSVVPSTTVLPTSPSSPKPNTTTVPTVSSSIPPVPPRIPLSISRTSSVVPSTTVLPTSPSSPKPNTTNAPTVKKPGDSGNIFSSTLIGVVLGGIAALVALVIIIVIIAKRRKKRTDNQRKISSAAMVVENESFEQGDDIEDDPSHPYASISPSVQPSTTASALNNSRKGKANNGGHRNSVANRVYGVVEELDSQPSKSNNENIKEGQQDPRNRTRKEPLPTISESPLFVTFRDPHNYENVNLNAPNPQNASVYDVIDGTIPPPAGPNGKDSRAHGASSNMSSESGHGPMVGEDGSFYDTVGGVIEN